MYYTEIQKYRPEIQKYKKLFPAKKKQKKCSVCIEKIKILFSDRTFYNR